MTNSRRTAARARLGAHMSIQGGFERAVERARSVDATALQVFVKSGRQWSAPPVDPDAARRFRRAVDDAGLAEATLAHAGYLINLASADEALWRRSVEALRDELRRCAALRIPMLVLHPGSHLGQGEAAGLERVARGLRRATARLSRRPMLLLENTAGQGTNLGHRFEHLGTLLDALADREGFGVCFDTCHAHAAGYDLSTAAGVRRALDALESACGAGRLAALHLNDSKADCGKRVDRHEHIGAGRIGLAGFRALLRDARARDLPMVLETHKQADLDDDRRNLAALRGLLPRARR